MVVNVDEHVPAARGTHMSDDTPGGVTRLLERLGEGDRAAVDELFPLVYEELRGVARRQRRRNQEHGTLGTTALVHEAYLKFAGQGHVGASNRAHFFALAARAMRHILINYADRGRALKRGAARPIPLSSLTTHAAEGALARPVEPLETLLALDTALAQLERISARQVRVVECRLFGGLTVEETAAAIGASPATVKRDWTIAQAFLYREMTARAGGAAR